MAKPPFCPKEKCIHHRKEHSEGQWYVRRGYYTTIRGKRIQRYQCKACRRTFSDRTFSVDYYEKKHLPYWRLLLYLCSGMGMRALARAFRCSPKTVANKIGRLARQILAITCTLQSRIRLNEDLVADGFESFVVSQYFPNTFTFLVGKKSQYVYCCIYAHLRRKGRMTEGQKKRAEYYRKRYPLPGQQTALSFTRVVDRILGYYRRSEEKKSLVVFTDEKGEYRRPLVEAAGCVTEGGIKPIHHVRINSKVRRDTRNDLWAVNYIESEIRKDLAEHHRETRCFARNVTASCQRMVVYLYYHNYMKAYRINRRECLWKTHGEAAGIDMKEVRSLSRHLTTRRQFLSLLDLDLESLLGWRRAYLTPKKQFMDKVPSYVFD